MVSPNPSHIPSDLIQSTDSVGRKMLRDCAATRGNFNPADMIWFERPTAIREPEWFELCDEFE